MFPRSKLMGAVELVIGRELSGHGAYKYLVFLILDFQLVLRCTLSSPYLVVRHVLAQMSLWCRKW